MAFVNKERGDDADDASATAPDSFDLDFDPHDPDVVKVHYDVGGWNFDHRAELSETLAERGIPHVWAEDEVVVPEAIESVVDALFDELEAELGPFPVMLGEGEPSTEFGLDEWPSRDLDMLKESLVEAEIPHRWDGRTLLVAHDAEDVVDDLLDAIEAGDVAVIDENAEAPDGALHELFAAADRLARDATHGPGRTTLLRLVPQLSPTVPPFGMSASAWGVIVGHAQAVVERFEEGADAELLTAQADELRTVCRPYV
jgi:hypothetical protein